MDIKIYQIDRKRDIENRKFFDLPEGKAVDPSIYDEVFSGSVDCNTFEDVYRKFNDEGHPLHRGHSLSVSDVVIMDGKAAICQGFGFKEVAFDASKAHKPDDLLRILYVEPGKPAYEAELGCDLRLLQKAVQGYIEHVYLDDVILVCNEEGKLKGMPPNRKLESGEIIAGPFFLVGETGEDYVSLTDAQVQKYLQMFTQPQDISRVEMMAGFGYTIITF